MEVPVILDELLSQAATVGGSSNVAVAGGFIRDIDNEIAPKDIDIFIYSGLQYRQNEEIARLFDVSEACVESFWRDYSVNNITSMYRLEYPGCEYPVQVMVGYWGNIEDVFKSFDINICKIAYNSKGELIESSEYLTGVKKKKIVATHASPHLDRVKAKFPAFSVGIKGHSSRLKYIGNSAKKDIRQMPAPYPFGGNLQAAATEPGAPIRIEPYQVGAPMQHYDYLNNIYVTQGQYNPYNQGQQAAAWAQHYVADVQPIPAPPPPYPGRIQYAPEEIAQRQAQANAAVLANFRNMQNARQRD